MANAKSIQTPRGLLTIVKVQTGIFEVQLEGKPTGWQVVNGSLGMSGRDTPNTYCVVKPGGSHVVVGPLVSAKSMALHAAAKAVLVCWATHIPLLVG